MAGLEKSQQFKMNMTDWKSVLHTGFQFLAPLGVIYFGAIVVALQTQGHTFNLNDLFPTQFQVGAMVLYIANRLFDISKKFVS